MSSSVLAIASSLALAQSSAQPSPGARADDVLLEMNQAFRKGDRKRLSALLPQVRGHALEPWAAYWELKLRLDDASASEVQDFFTRYANTYQEDRLRNDWLQLLGQRRDWSQFATQHPALRMSDDREVKCYALLIDHLKGQGAPNIGDQVRQLWLSLRDAEDGCTLAADRLVDARKLSTADVWRKARLSVEQNRGRAARNAVQIVAPQWVPQVNDLMANPARFLTQRKMTTGKARAELVVLALIRMAANDPEAAAGMLGRTWSHQLNVEQRNATWGAIGRYSAGRLSDEALGHYGHVTQLSDLHDESLAWLARAALRARGGPQWAWVLRAVHAMTPEFSRDPTWVYWHAKALLAGRPAQRPDASPEARALLESIADGVGFYEQLAQEELGRPLQLVATAPAPTAAERDAVRQNPGLQRGLLAIQLGLRPEGVREWNYSAHLVTAQGQAGSLSSRELLAAAQWACEREVYDRCISSAERTARADIDTALRYPMPFKDAVLRRSREIGLDPATVYGLIRQESRFVMDARSGVGASGLMQVMPPTARWTAKKLGMTGFTVDRLADRDTNIAIGTGYLKYVLDDFGGSLPLAAAAYNAGPSRPRAWRPGDPAATPVDAAIWAENVPIHETRDYVKKVAANANVYAALLSSAQAPSLKNRLGSIGPRSPSAPPENQELP